MSILHRLSPEDALRELTDGDLDQRVRAAERLAKAKDASAVEALTAALEDGDSRVRDAVIRALEKVGEPAAASLRTAAAKGHPIVQAGAAEALASIGDGITVRNPFRDHWIPWGAVGSVVVGESVQLHCSRGPGTDREKVVHSWALYSSRRARVKSGLPPRRSLFQQAAPPSRLPKEAQELLKQSPADHIAGELDLQARLARERGAPAGGLAGSWPWHAFAAALIPAAALLIVLLAH